MSQMLSALLLLLLSCSSLTLVSAKCGAGLTACGAGCYTPCKQITSDIGRKFYYTCTDGALGQSSKLPSSCSGSAFPTGASVNCGTLSYCASAGRCQNFTIDPCVTSPPTTFIGTTAPSSGQLVSGCPAPAALAVSNPVGKSACSKLCTEDSTYYLSASAARFPAQNLTLGRITYTVSQLQDIMQRGQPGNPPPSGDQSLQLAYTLVATLENIAAGSATSSSNVQQLVSYAQAYLAAYPIDRPNSNVNPSGCTQKNQEAVAAALFLYNCGYSAGSPGGCAGVSCRALANGYTHSPAVYPGYQTCKA